MASYDIIAAVGKAYNKVWEERDYLIRLSAVPILIKFAGIMAVLMADLDSHLRSEFLLLPAYFAEGWMVAHFVRLIFLGQRWPFKMTGDEEADLIALNDKARGILSAMITYVLLHMLIVMCFVGLSMLPVTENDLRNPSAALHVGAVAGFVLLLWGFRYLWVYIPLALNVPLKEYARVVVEPKLSFYMLGTWLVCFIPAFLMILFFTLPILVPAEGEEVSMVAKVAVSWVQAMIEAATALIVTGGIAYGIKALYEGESEDGKS